MTHVEPRQVVDERLVAETFEFLGLPGFGLLELRVIDPRSGQGAGVGFFDDSEAALAACREHSGRANVYVGVQPRPLRLLGGAMNRVLTGVTASRDDDVEVLASTVIDLDPVRPKGVAATPEQREAARGAAEPALAWVQARGFQRPVLCDSGNGVQIWFAFPRIPVTPESRTRLSAALRLFEHYVRSAVAAGYKPERPDLAVKVDTVSNLSRVIKVMGTLSVKGDPAAWRLARPFDGEEFFRQEDANLGETLQKVTLEQARKVLGEAALQASPAVSLGSVPAEVPERFLKADLLNPKIAATWEGRRPDLKDESGSGYDMALADLLALSEQRYSNEEAAAILRAFKHGSEQSARPSYLARTIAKARAGAAQIAATREAAAEHKEAAVGAAREGLEAEIDKAPKDLPIADQTKLLAAFCDRVAALPDVERGPYVHKLTQKFKGVGRSEVRRLIAVAARRLAGNAAPAHAGPDLHLAGEGEPAPDRARYREPVYVYRDGCTLAEEPHPETNARVLRPIANFCIHIERDEAFDNGVDQRRTLHGYFERSHEEGGGRYPFSLDAGKFENNQKLAEAVGGIMGAAARYDQRNLPKLRAAAKSLSAVAQRRVSGKFGWTDDRSAYVTPSVLITREGEVRPNVEVPVDLGHTEKAHRLDLKIGTDEEVRRVGEHVVADVLEIAPHTVTYPMAGHTFISPFVSFLARRGFRRTALWLQVKTGYGKSYAAACFQCFFGDFRDEGAIVSWASTTNSLQFEGYHFADALLLVDDFKLGSVKQGHLPDVKAILQNYADGTGRGRLDRTGARARHSYFIRGNLMVTAEDIVPGEASLLGRSLVVHVPQHLKDIARGARCMAAADGYPAFMAAFITWAAREARERGGIEEALVAAAEALKARFFADIAGRTNDARIASNLALNALGFRLFTGFLKSLGVVDDLGAEAMAQEHEEVLLALRQDTVESVEEEQASNLFLEALRQALASGRAELYLEGEKVWVRTELRESKPSEHRNVVGVVKRGSPHLVHLFPKPALAVVKRLLEEGGTPFCWSEAAIGRQLRGDGVLAKLDAEERSAGVTRFEGRPVRAWVVERKLLESEAEDANESPPPF